MRYIDIRPDLLGAGVLEVIERVDMEVVLGCMEGMNEWYEEKLPLWGVLRVYGEDGVCGDDENVTVSCRLPMHGGGDIHASAKYFRDDRESGRFRPAVYCYKCQRVLNSFWYVHTQEKERRGRNLRGVLKFIYERFGVEPPLSLWWEWDDAAGSSRGVEEVVTDLFTGLLGVVRKKGIDRVGYHGDLKRILMGGVV